MRFERWLFRLLSSLSLLIYFDSNTPVCFTVLFCVLVVSDQSAVPDVSSAENNFIGHFTMFVYTTDLIGSRKRVGAIAHTVNVWIFCAYFLLHSWPWFVFARTSYRRRDRTLYHNLLVDVLNWWNKKINTELDTTG